MPEEKPNRPPRILVVDDHLSLAETVAEGLSESGFDAIPLASSQQAALRLREEAFDALVTDLRMPQVDGLGLLKISLETAPARPVIVMTAYSAVESAIESIRQGAYHYLTKPFKVEELVLFLNRALEDSRLRRETASLRSTLRERFGLENLVGHSQAMRQVAELVERLAHANTAVLIYGETGTGKGLVARALHAQGERAAEPFVAINCAALPENLLESELFGHVKGAFTGATATRTGLFVDAHRGTLFLDEIGDIAPSLQAKLLHVLETGTVRPVGANKEQHVDVRVIAATHRDLHERVASGAFREDLLYRLDVVSIEIPPLRLRQGDIPELLEHFLKSARLKHPQSQVQRISKAALERLLDHRWPGNVRELEHVVERLVLLGRGQEIQPEELPRTVAQRAAPGVVFQGEILPIRELQRRYATWVFEALGGHHRLTAEKLDVDVKTLARWLKPAEPDKSDA